MGTGTTQSLLQLREAAKSSAKPAVVMLVYGSFHDERSTLLRRWRKYFAQFNRLGEIHQPYARFDRNDRLQIRHEALAYNPPQLLLRQSALVQAVDELFNQYEDYLVHSHLVAKSLILEMERTTTELRANFVVALLTDRDDTKEMGSFLRRRGIATVDLALDFDDPRFNNLPYDAHPSALANKIFADRAYDAIVSTGRMPQ